MQIFKTCFFLLLLLSFQQFTFSQEKDNKYRITLDAGYRTLQDFVPERTSGDFTSCGACSQSARRIDSPDAGVGGYLQATLHLNRIFIPFQIGILKWNDNFEGTVREDYHHPHAPSWWGPITQYREYTISYHSISHYLNFSYGVGFNVFKPTSKFHFGPIVRFNPQHLLSRKEIFNNVQEHYRKYQNPPPPGTLEDIETFSNSNNAEEFIAFRKVIGNDKIWHNLALSAGMSSSGILFKSFGYSIEAGYQWQNFSRVALGDIEQRSSFYTQFGILYQIWNKNQKH